MKKTTKGALAGGAAGVLLLGGAGTVAYWTDSETVTGGAVNSGELSLTQETGQTCSSWTLDAAGGATTYTPGTTLVVPGDVITKTCTYTVNASGAHLAATLGFEAPSITGDAALDGALSPAASYTLASVAVTNGAAITSANDGDVLVATITVTFASATSGLTAQNEAAVLDDISVSLTQTHA